MTTPTTETESMREVVLNRAAALVQFARECGMVLTIETQSRQPLAMGHYDMVVGVRPARVMAPLEWDALWAAMDAAPDAWIPTTEAMYWHMLGCVPPRCQLGDRFLVGEPLRHNTEGKAVHACFKEVGSQFFAKNMTVEQFQVGAA